MIMTVEELRAYINTEETDDVLAMRLEATECMIHGYTNNNFNKYRVGEKIAYPADVKLGVVNLLKWEQNNRDKVGVASESISRHSVTYFDMTAENTAMGYPVSLLGFLKPYMRARFGQGLSV
jgi:hypothetical protein